MFFYDNIVLDQVINILIKLKRVYLTWKILTRYKSTYLVYDNNWGGCVGVQKVRD